MKPSLLTQLGCLGSIAFVLSIASAAQAGTITERTIIYSSVSQPSTPNSVLSPDKNNEVNPVNLSPDESLDQKAIARYGCDCNSCQNQILQQSLK